MRRLSHTELNDCRQHPRQWVQSKVTPGGGHPVFGYRQALVNAIVCFHKTDSRDKAEEKLENSLSHFQNQARIDEVWDQFESYVTWIEQNGVIVADARIGLDAPFGNRLHLGGIVSRLDVTERGYRAIVFHAPIPQWRQQLRFPLIQAAIAFKYSRELRNIEVGVQDVDGTGLDLHKYSERAVTNARREFRNIESAVIDAAQHLPGGLTWLDRVRQRR